MELASIVQENFCKGCWTSEAIVCSTLGEKTQTKAGMAEPRGGETMAKQDCDLYLSKIQEHGIGT